MIKLTTTSPHGRHSLHNQVQAAKPWSVALLVAWTLSGSLGGAETLKPADSPQPNAGQTVTPFLPPKVGLEEVNHALVDVRGGFWGPRLKTHHEVTIPHGLNALEKGGHVTNFDKAAGVFDGPLQGHHAFDSDLHKGLEGAVLSAQHFDDSALRQRIESILARVLAPQQKDGFLISYWIVNGLDKRWENLRLEHQMYNAGHFFEMAVAQHQLTGETKVLTAAKRFADHIDSIFGPNKIYDVDGHQEVELALVKLYRATGEQRYLDLSRFFLEERGYVHGTEHRRFDPATIVQPVKPEGPLTAEQKREFWHERLKIRNGRMQDHKPVVEQYEAVGHAVRAGYLYSAMADMVRFMDAPGYEKALDHLWEDVVGRKMYVTGTIGTGQYDDEGFGDPYLLPNDSAYGESCAAIALILWQHRMNLLKGQAKYADVMELALYNGMLSGISLAGNSFFYENPLASKNGAKRSPWIGIACCPTNLMRIIPQVGGLAYARSKGHAYVNLYMAGQARIALDDQVAVTLTQETTYPWEGRVKIAVAPTKTADFTVCLRIPSWSQGRPVPSDLYRFTDTQAALPITLTINGEKADATPQADGYVHLKRSWKTGDVVELNLPMPIQRIHAHEKVLADKGKVALMRGPMMYCLEGVDHPGTKIANLVLPAEAVLTAEHRADLLRGVTVLLGQALDDKKNPVPLTAIPYYAWQNRGKSPMYVWISDTPTTP